ncbi:MAG TPA: stage III sporulation protein AF [Bacillota bacterium]
MEILEGVKLWVRNIAVVIIAAGFLEMVLPQGDLQRFARLVVGFFILLAIIQPLIGFFHQQVAVDTAFLEAAAANSPDTAAVLAKGRELQAGHDRAALDQYRLALERQVTAIASMTGAEARSVSVDLDADPKSSTFGAVRSIRVVAARPAAPSESTVVVPVDPVQIDFGGPDAAAAATDAATGEVPPADAVLCSTLARTLAGYYGLAPEAVRVTAGQ